MAKYYTYAGKPVGLVRKMLDDVVFIEDAWISEVNTHLGKNGYDGLLGLVAQILSAGGHPAITRAQAWIVLTELFRSGVPEVLQDTAIDEVSNKGNLFVSLKKTTAAAVDTVTYPIGKAVGGSISAVSGVLPKKGKGTQVTEDVEE